MRETATAPALTESWRGSVTARGKRERAGTVIGREGSEGIRIDDDPAAQTGFKSDESVEEVAAAAETERANVETKTEMAGMTGARGRTGNIIKIEALKERDQRTKRTGERLMTEGIKTTGRGTEKREKPKGQAGVEARKRGTKVGERRRAGKETAATAEIETGRETESSVLTNVVVAERGAIISESPVMIIVNIVNAKGVRVLSKCPLQQYFYFCSCFSSFFLPVVWSVTCAKEKECQHIGYVEVLSLASVILLYVCLFFVFCLFHSPLDHR